MRPIRDLVQRARKRVKAHFIGSRVAVVGVSENKENGDVGSYGIRIIFGTETYLKE